MLAERNAPCRWSFRPVNPGPFGGFYLTRASQCDDVMTSKGRGWEPLRCKKFLRSVSDKLGKSGGGSGSSGSSTTTIRGRAASHGTRPGGTLPASSSGARRGTSAAGG